MNVALRVNGKTEHLDIDPGTPLLYVLRGELSSTLRNSGAGSANAAHARCWSTMSRSSRA